MQDSILQGKEWRSGTWHSNFGATTCFLRGQGQISLTQIQSSI